MATQLRHDLIEQGVLVGTTGHTASGDPHLLVGLGSSRKIELRAFGEDTCSSGSITVDSVDVSPVAFR
jgi:hypothetical protein